MIRRNSKIGNASPILKACMAIGQEEIVTSPVIYAFEGRLESKIQSGLVFNFGERIASLATSLPSGDFKLDEFFYERRGSGFRLEGSDEIYESIGAYADSLDYDSGHVSDTKQYLESAAKYLAKAYSDVKIEEMPSEAELSLMFVKDGKHSEIRKRMTKAFREASEKGVFNELLFEAMSGVHSEHIGKLSEAFLFVADLITGVEIYEVMPFGVATEGLVAQVYSIFLPILMAGGMYIDQESFFKYRLERGREMLKELVGSETIEGDPEDVIAKALDEKIKDFAPYVDEEFLDYASGANIGFVASNLVENVWEAKLINIHNDEEIDYVMDGLRELFEQLSVGED